MWQFLETCIFIEKKIYLCNNYVLQNMIQLPVTEFVGKNSQDFIIIAASLLVTLQKKVGHYDFLWNISVNFKIESKQYCQNILDTLQFSFMGKKKMLKVKNDVKSSYPRDKYEIVGIFYCCQFCNGRFWRKKKVLLQKYFHFFDTTKLTTN